MSTKTAGLEANAKCDKQHGRSVVLLNRISTPPHSHTNTSTPLRFDTVARHRRLSIADWRLTIAAPGCGSSMLINLEVKIDSNIAHAGAFRGNRLPVLKG